MREGQKRNFARGLRRSMTDAERRLWQHLRSRRLSGYKFRRQVPIGRYVADFVCLEAGLIIEVDGGQHADLISDVHRDRCLHERGFIVLRFWNNDVLIQTESVLESILRSTLSRCPHPNPLP